MREYLSVACAAAREAGALQREAMAGEVRVEHKGAIDLVTEVDRRCEALVAERLRAAFPDHRLVGEEGGDRGGTSPWCWYVDPLDGTTNFAHRFPYFCVSIALAHEGRVVVGAVYDPLRDELFAATAGGGATLNDRPLQVSRVDRLIDALLSTGFPTSVHAEGNNVAQFLRFLGRCQAVRRAGSAALDLCSVAAGRFDGFWEPGLKAWDVAAGSLIVQEAGGTVTDYEGGGLDLGRGQILATNGPLHAEMMRLIADPVAITWEVMS